jgi:hypothetical protein
MPTRRFMMMIVVGSRALQFGQYPVQFHITHYVESERLELWDRESYSWKLRWTQHMSGRSLLAVVGLQAVPTLTNVSSVFQSPPKPLDRNFYEAY